MPSSHLLLDGVTEDTTGDGQRYSAPAISVFVDGDLGSGDLTIEIARDIDGEAGDYETVYTVTTDKRFNLFFFGFYWIRAVLANSTNPDLTVAIQ